MASSASKHSLDFTNVKEGGNFSKKHMPAGDYLAKITKAEDADPKDKADKTPMWLFTIQLKSTPSATYPYYCKLQDNQLWKVRNLLVAAGINVPKKKVGVDPTKLVGKIVAVSLDDTEYNGKEQSEIGAVFSPSDLDADVEPEDDDDVDDADDEDAADDDDEEAPEPPKKKKKAKVEEPEEDDEDEETSDDSDDEDEEPAPPVKKKKTKKERRLEREAKAKAAAAAAEDDDDDDEDEDDEPTPPKKKKKAAKPAADEDDDDEIDIEDLD